MLPDHLPLVQDEGFAAAVPRGLVGLATEMVRARADVSLAVERGLTMSALAETLAAQERPARVTTREANGTEWTITIGGTEVTQP